MRAACSSMKPFQKRNLPVACIFQAAFLLESMPALQLTASLYVQGSCGYGSLNKQAYPFWSVAALSTSNRFYKAGPANGCGECFEIQCQNSGGKFAVSSTAISALSGRLCKGSMFATARLPGQSFVAVCLALTTVPAVTGTLQL